MDKVELTKKQAAAIEELKTKFSNEQIVANNVKYRIAKTNHDHLHHEFVKLNLDILIKALYIGYEIKEEFKVGDWVKANWRLEKPTIHKLKGIDRNTVEIDGEQNNTNPGISIISLATPEEIAEEKERRWWAKHGREVWELKVGDILIYGDAASETSEIVEITRVADDRIYFNDGNMEYMCDINLGYKVVCFAENRLDLQ